MMILSGFRLRGIGNCPTIPGMPGYCDYGGMTIDCRQIRECDEQTGAQHFEYVISDGRSVNPNIWRWNSAATGGTGTGNWLWSNAPGSSQAAPPVWTQPDVVDGTPVIDLASIRAQSSLPQRGTSSTTSGRESSTGSRGESGTPGSEARGGSSTAGRSETGSVVPPLNPNTPSPPIDVLDDVAAFWQNNQMLVIGGAVALGILALSMGGRR